MFNTVYLAFEVSERMYEEGGRPEGEEKPK